MSSREEILDRIRSSVLNIYPDAKIFLYGSRARETAGRDSDWDLLILLSMEKVGIDIEKEISYPLYDLEFEIGQIISPMIYSEIEWETKYQFTPFYKNIKKEGLRL